MPRMLKVSKKPYRARSSRRLDLNTAKAALETNAVARDVGARAMLKSISKLRAGLQSKVTESIPPLSEKPIR
jgi:hypothetical protein